MSLAYQANVAADRGGDPRSFAVPTVMQTAGIPGVAWHLKQDGLFATHPHLRDLDPGHRAAPVVVQQGDDVTGLQLLAHDVLLLGSRD
jgi:hypothetical protein